MKTKTELGIEPDMRAIDVLERPGGLDEPILVRNCRRYRLAPMWDVDEH